MRPSLRRLGLALALLAAGVLVLLARAWAPDRPVSSLEARWAQAPSTFIDVDGLRVHVRDEGPRTDPHPLVLLHGTSASLHTWDGWAQALRGERRVIRFDLPGFGLTGPRPDGDYRLEAYVHFTLALLERLQVPRAVLGGNSFGGYVAWATALARPERVAGLVLVDAAGYPGEARSMPIGFRLARIPALVPLMQRVLPRSVVEASLRNTYGHPERVTPELVDRYYELTLREGNRRAVAERFRQSQNSAALSARVRELRLPTLILWGGRDELIPPENGERFHRDIAGSERVVLTDLGHVPHEEDPARTVAPVRDFLARLGK
jgi:pimeloyl-ACP methyl ester carboxylesterase